MNIGERIYDKLCTTYTQQERDTFREVVGVDFERCLKQKYLEWGLIMVDMALLDKQLHIRDGESISKVLEAKWGKAKTDVVRKMSTRIITIGGAG